MLLGSGPDPDLGRDLGPKQGKKRGAPTTEAKSENSPRSSPKGGIEQESSLAAEGKARDFLKYIGAFIKLGAEVQ